MVDEGDDEDDRMGLHEDSYKLDHDDVTEFFEFSAEDEARLMPEGCPPSLDAEFEASCSRRMMFRGADLAARTAAAAGQSLVLTGPRGSGKSVVLANLVAWARSEGRDHPTLLATLSTSS